METKTQCDECDGAGETCANVTCGVIPDNCDCEGENFETCGLCDGNGFLECDCSDSGPCCVHEAEEDAE